MHVTLEEMRALIRNHSVTILDVLAHDAYSTAHLPRAINIPLAVIRDRASVELPDRSRRIVVYCGSPT
jgi:rhodanese-related sulfurtransferase